MSRVNKAAYGCTVDSTIEQYATTCDMHDAHRRNTC
jgi:hypothetical protein